MDPKSNTTLSDETRKKIAEEVSMTLSEMKDVAIKESITTVDLSPKDRRYEITGSVSWKTSK